MGGGRDGFEWDVVGATAIVVLVAGKKLYCANLGDGVAKLHTGEGDVSLSKTHTPMDREEVGRIVGAGGKVIHDRVDGVLAVSRALGFQFMKNQ